MISINTSPTELILLDSLNNSTFGLNKTIERLTTGYKINHAKDDAVGVNIVTQLSTKISSLLKIKNNTEDGISLLSTAQGALEEIQEQLARLRELSTQAMNGTYDEQSRKSMQAEADAIIENIKQIRNNTEFNGLKLFESTLPNTNGTEMTNKSANPAKRLADSARVRTMSLQNDVSTLSDDNVLEGTFDINANSKKTVNIDGVDYTFQNNLNGTNSISYSKDLTTGQLTIYASNTTIRGQLDVAHNILIIGNSNTLYTGNLDDIIEAAVGSSGNNVHGLEGDDIFISSDASIRYAYGEEGNDTFNGNFAVTWGGDGDDIFNVISGTHYGEAGNDIFNITGGGSYYGGDGNDTFNVTNGNGMGLYGGNGDDTFNLISGKNITANGGEGNDTIIDNATNTTKVNLPGANIFSEYFEKNETKTIKINNIDYTITNNSSARDMLYAIEPDGQINFKTSYLTIRGDENKAHNVNLTAGNITFYGGKLNDTIAVDGSLNNVYAGDGDDTITVRGANCYIDAGDGDDMITGRGHLHGGNGNDTIIITSNGMFYGDAGNDTIISNSALTLSYIDGGDGDDNISLCGRETRVVVTGGNGNNTITNTGVTNSLFQGFDKNEDSGFVDLLAGETKTVIINNISYTIKNNSTTTSSRVIYYHNKITNEISFGGRSISITGQNDAEHNVLIYGRYINFYGGNKDDIVTNHADTSNIYGQGGNDTLTNHIINSKLYGGDGDDRLTTYAYGGGCHGEDGDDIIDIYSGGGSYSGGNGNDTYNIYTTCSPTDISGDNIFNINASNCTINASDGSDTFYINGNNNTVRGGGGNDYFVINGENNTIDGGTGNDFFVDNSSGTTTTMNVIRDPNAGALIFTYIDEEQTVIIDNKTYTVTNQNADGTAPASNIVQYSYNPNTKTITFDGSNVTIDCTSDSNKLNIRGNNNTVNGGNGNDIITVEKGENNIINGLGGNDTLIMNSANNSLNGGEGNDTITLNSSTDKSVTGGNGNDTINVNSSNNTDIDMGNGDDKIIIKGENNSINANEGNNTITLNGANNEIEAGDGNNKLVVTTNDNNITLGNGNNSIGIQGNGNILEAGNATGDINIIGKDNDIAVLNGENNVKIKGSNNSFYSETGDKTVTIDGNGNNVQTGNGDDEFIIRGNNNNFASTEGENKVNIRGDENYYQGGDGKDNITISGNRNTTNGGDSSDTFMVGKGSNNIIDGEDGERNTMINNGVNTQFTNVVDITPRPFELGVKVDLGTSANSFVNVSISFNLFDFYLDFMSDRGLSENLEKIDDLLSQVETQLLNISTSINRLTNVLEEQDIQLQNMLSTRSTFKDADIAKESSNFIKYQILQQASATLLSTANQSPAIALQLI